MSHYGILPIHFRYDESRITFPATQFGCRTEKQKRPIISSPTYNFITRLYRKSALRKFLFVTTMCYQISRSNFLVMLQRLSTRINSMRDGQRLKTKEQGISPRKSLNDTKHETIRSLRCICVNACTWSLCKGRRRRRVGPPWTVCHYFFVLFLFSRWSQGQLVTLLSQRSANHRSS